MCPFTYHDHAEFISPPATAMKIPSKCHQNLKRQRLCLVETGLRVLWRLVSEHPNPRGMTGQNVASPDTI